MTKTEKCTFEISFPQNECTKQPYFKNLYQHILKVYGLLHWESNPPFVYNCKTI